jgi:hypothetical protein
MCLIKAFRTTEQKTKKENSNDDYKEREQRHGPGQRAEGAQQRALG